MPEQFDLVDASDTPTGKLTTKLDAHANGQLHRLVAVYVFDREGKLLVQDHKASGLLDHSVGGHVTAGESYDESVVREAAEELNLVGATFEAVFIGLYSDEHFDAEIQTTVQKHFFGIYECQPSTDWKFVPNDEVERIIPMEIADVVRQMNDTPGRFTPGFINTMAKYLEVKQLPYLYDVDKARIKWGKTVNG